MSIDRPATLTEIDPDRSAPDTRPVTSAARVMAAGETVGYLSSPVASNHHDHRDHDRQDQPAGHRR